ncbi:tubulin-tyrosine ligase [Cylindrobasidium torrendii FP15055 ss-10]|uniref:Tubulin-tyrosine ligase n=1 Tax=Cylindrobasidium torrendii FP15055 ss-10 TaxID=1314674 RepID=A0A0D7BQE3_9AGAR|nr:tubulin-tyrosine ligase [Cylindrobasidium torrendii FP15055 ss-10]
MKMISPFAAYVHWPSAPFTESLVRKSLKSLEPPPVFIDTPTAAHPNGRLVQWSSYDEIDHELVLANSTTVLSSSFVIRKALTRKHFLSRSILSYVTKNPESALKNGAPATYEIEISFADELDEALADDLWELGRDLNSDTPRWWILKPGMADRGNGIRLFNSLETLERIFQEFEEDEDEEEDGGEEEEGSTAVITSQLRHFVIQEYLPSPVLVDPLEVSVNGSVKPAELRGRKFHLRAYCVASGSLKVYLYRRILALFSSTPYTQPQSSESGEIDLLPHLTNTSLQTEHGEENVRLLDELLGSQLFDVNGADIGAFNESHIDDILTQMTAILADAFEAGLQNPVHFQALPNAFELYGVDFLVSFTPGNAMQVSLLEFNSEPAIELTGPRLAWILEDLFATIGKVCVSLFFSTAKDDNEEWTVGETKHEFTKCLEKDLHF